jgi:hypothetical protein
MPDLPYELQPKTGPGAAPTLAYDSYSPLKDRRSRWLVPGYWLGNFLMASFYGVITTLLSPIFKPEVIFDSRIDGLVFSLAFALLMLLPATITLGLSLWLCTKFLTNAHYARFRTAVLTGIIGGGYPIFCFRFFSIYDQRGSIFALIGLAWNVLFPIAAGFWLCRRSHVRD